jgi:hypothetical protein
MGSKTSDLVRRAILEQGITPNELINEIRIQDDCCGNWLEAILRLIDGGPCAACIACAVLSIIIRQKNATRH